MTSAWSKPTSRDDRADGRVTEPQFAEPQFTESQLTESQFAESEVIDPRVADRQAGGPGESQLDMFETLSRAGGGRARRSAAGSDGDARARTVEVIGPSPAKRDVLDVGGPDSDELRRLEESIRWLMNAGTMRHLPAAANLSQAEGLSPLQAARDDSLILDPEALFTPRAPQRRGGDILRSTAKILMVSAIAAPTAYFVASWAQFPGQAATSDPAVVAAAVPAAGPPGVQVAALEPTSMPEAVRAIEGVATVLPQAAQAPVEKTSVEKTPDIARSTAEASAAEVKVASLEQPRIAAVPPADPGQTARAEGEAAPLAAIPVAVPPKSSMPPDELALMVERGRTLFDSGDLAAARLFFRRAANAGDAGAAIAMGATYDPEVLGQRFIRGIVGDAREAQKWYDKARALGGGTRIEMAHR